MTGPDICSKLITNNAKRRVMMHQFTLGTDTLQIHPLEEGVFRVRLSSSGNFSEPLLTKYHILKTDFPAFPSVADFQQSTVTAGKFLVSIYEKTKTLTFSGGAYELAISLSGFEGSAYQNDGYCIAISLDEKERLFGLGDEDRTAIMKRGKKSKIWQTNVTSYAPIPYLMSSLGWSFLNNCTYAQTFDLGATQKDKVQIQACQGVIDFFVFLSDSMPGALNLYTDVAGKPLVLPKYAYGFTFVCNEEEGARELLEDCLHFRQEDIPCDTMGLEPGWMETLYDYSVNKKWDPTRFYIPYWQPKNYGGSWSFFYNLRQMGFRLSLWLCCDYDLLWEEEHTYLDIGENSFDGAEIIDEHFAGTVVMDQITKPKEPWFEHLKKFVDQGASAFKLDGAKQVLEHPDRLWAGKYLDAEVHNVYPVIYSKQMKEGFSNYTGKRALIYTPALYAGSQQYCASWAGDTGGGADTLVSILNLALCGHTNASCDMDPTDLKGIHYGFLMPWSQLLGWRNWHHPWFLGEELKEGIRFYSKLRSSLFPYLYSMAHKAADTGLPMARPLSLMYPDVPEYDTVLNTYLLGDSFLVSAFSTTVTLPEGGWIDFWTGDYYSGGTTISYTPPSGRGGALFVKAGSIFAMQAPMPYLDKAMPDHYNIRIYPGSSCSFTLVEDDGISYDYLHGGKAETHMQLSAVEQNQNTFTLEKRAGSFLGRAANWPYDQNATYDTDDSPKCPPVSGFTIELYAPAPPASITLDGKTVSFDYDQTHKTAVFEIPAQRHEAQHLEYHICYQ